MILLFDSNPRAEEARRVFPSAVVLWRANAWRDFNGTEWLPTDDEVHWLLVHATDIGEESFQTMLSGQEAFIRSIPWVRFSGGSPANRPDHEYWVRYRSLESEPFAKEELEALDEWVKKGCNLHKRPWVLLEEKPHYLRGLLMMLRVAEMIGPVLPVGEAKRRGFDIESPDWWRERLGKEPYWQTAVLNELIRRCSNQETLAAFDSFVTWVDGTSAVGNPRDLLVGLRCRLADSV